jgi:hypothetical protein
LAVGVVTLALLGAGPASADPSPHAYGGTKECPADGGGFNAKKLKGKRLEAARELALRHGCTVRVVRRNGRNLPVTADLKPNRINVAIKGKKKRIVKVFPTG